MVSFNLWSQSSWLRPQLPSITSGWCKMDGDADVSTSVGASILNSEKDLFVGHGYSLYQPTLVQTQGQWIINSCLTKKVRTRENILYIQIKVPRHNKLKRKKKKKKRGEKIYKFLSCNIYNYWVWLIDF